ncbi:MAG: MFS transporter [Rubrivivax sp.]|nr:MFS transporter [Rubrivivax sp.]
MTSDGAPRRVLPLLVLAQFAGTSPWFAVNAVMPDLQLAHGWPDSALGTLTSAVQAGFILGTLVFALGGVADRYRPRHVFLACALAAALCTLAALASASHLGALHGWRAATGFCLAGIYPVGMKIAAQWYRGGLGGALGWLVGALVLGSASPHALRGLLAASPQGDLPWGWVMIAVAVLAAASGVLVARGLPDAPSARPAAGPPRAGPDGALGAADVVAGPSYVGALASLWTERRVRASVLGYFGHMVELYTMWVLVPLVLATRLQGAAVSWAAFGVVGAGALGCGIGGWIAQRAGSARVAGVQLAASGLCCAVAPWALGAPDALFILWLAVWGITVAGDSPQLSALTARNAPPHAVGTVLTFTNCLGFAISIASIECFVRWTAQAPLAQVLPWLGLGPLLGVLALRPLLREPRTG